MNFNYPESKAINQPAKKLIVFLHGVGSDGYDLISLVPYIQQDLPDYYFISPHGIEPYDMAPFGRQWFSLQDRSPAKLRYLMDVNVDLVRKIIKLKQEELDITNEDTIIIGFSQGTMLGIYLNLTSKEPFAKMIGCSGALIEPEICNNKITPICLIHGTEDNIVSISALDHASKYLTMHDIPHKIHSISNLGHSINSKVLELAVNFIKEEL